jgi:uncharacterized protein
MLIRRLTPDECQEMMTRAAFGRLGCAIDGQPYVVPIYFTYEPGRIYSFTTLGQKIEWMRKNPKVCVEVDEVVDHFRWMSVIATGRYQELSNTPELRSERLHALKVLDKNLLWWQTAFAARELPSSYENPETLFYCIHIDSMTGLRAVPPVESTVNFADQARTI